MFQGQPPAHSALDLVHVEIGVPTNKFEDSTAISTVVLPDPPGSESATSGGDTTPPPLCHLLAKTPPLILKSCSSDPCDKPVAKRVEPSFSSGSTIARKVEPLALAGLGARMASVGDVAKAEPPAPASPRIVDRIHRNTPLMVSWSPSSPVLPTSSTLLREELPNSHGRLRHVASTGTLLGRPCLDIAHGAFSQEQAQQRVSNTAMRRTPLAIMPLSRPGHAPPPVTLQSLAPQINDLGQHGTMPSPHIHGHIISSPIPGAGSAHITKLQQHSARRVHSTGATVTPPPSVRSGTPATPTRFGTPGSSSAPRPATLAWRS